MPSVVRGKALVAKLRADPKTRDAEALAAWIGRYKRLRQAGIPAGKARGLAGTVGGLAKGGVKPGTKTTKPTTKPKSIDLVGGGKATYNPETKTVRIPNDAIGLEWRNKSKANIEAIEKAFPEAERIEAGKSGGMPIAQLRRAFGIEDRNRSGIPSTTRTPGPDEPRNDPDAQRRALEAAIERRRLAREAEDAKRKAKEARLGINVRRARPFYDGNNVLIRAEQDREPTERDKANILQAYPGAKTFTWNGKQYPLRKEGPEAGVKAPLEDFFTIPAGGGKRLEGARDAIRAVGNVHDARDLTPIPITTKREGRGRLGTFTYGYDGKPKQINVAAAEHPRTTIAHEIGHYLDFDGLGDKGSYASRDLRSELAPVMRRIEASPTVERLRDMHANPEKYGTTKTFTSFDGTTHEYTTTPSRKHLNYMDSPEEIFARAYAQYITRKSGNPKMKKEMAEQIKESHLTPSSYPSQWTDKEFAPIEKAFDKMFSAKGWLK